MKHIVIATYNEGKLEEIKPSLLSFGYTVHSMGDFPHMKIKEDGKTLKDNAIIKARAVSQITNFKVLADDSGLEVEALEGAPGVHSARFSSSGTDADNNARLLKLMEDKTNRRAWFKTVMVLKNEAGEERVFEGRLDGYIHTASEGLEGFGYDPVFIPAGHNQTLAQLGDAVKRSISHRQLALNRLTAHLRREDD